jgi:hypothetical protein
MVRRAEGSADRTIVIVAQPIYGPSALIKRYAAEQRRRDQRLVTLMILATGAVVPGNDAKCRTTLVGCCA